jgi:tripartite-type tricarboxylate transporter receptor subunit TctC
MTRHKFFLGALSVLVFLFVHVTYGSFLSPSLEVVASAEAAAAGAEPFYKGKTLRIVVGFPAGGGYDVYARLLSRFMEKHIPGNPSIIVQNMPGAGSMIAANYVYEVAKPDGLTMALVARELYLAQIGGVPELKIDFRKFIPLISLTDENPTIYMRTDTPYTSIRAIQEAVQQGKPLPRMGATGVGSTGYVLPRVVEELLGMKLFNIIAGYPGGPDVDLALVKNEIHGAGRTYVSLLERSRHMLEKGEITVILQGGTGDRKRAPYLPQVPTYWELAKTEEDKALVASLLVSYNAARPFFLSPGVPSDRVRILREAATKTVKAPEFLAEAERTKRPIDPLSGEEMESMYKEALQLSPRLKALWKELLGR